MPTDLGFCTHDSIAYPLLVNQEMASVKTLGGHHVRIGMWWALVEETKGHFSGYPDASTFPNKLPRGFEAIDLAVNAALSQGLDVLLLLNVPPPPWASTTSFADYANFCAKAAQRYKPGGSAISAANSGKGVVRYEILNEVNFYGNWNQGGWFGSGAGVNVVQIAAFHKAAYAAIKVVQPDAGVGGWGMAAVADALGGWFASGPAQVRPASFVKQMIEAGCGPVDFITYHPYTLANDFTTFQSPSVAHPFNVEITNIRNVLVSKGLSNIPIDLTEWGYPTSVFGDAVAAHYIQQQWDILHGAIYGPLVRDHYVYCARDFAMPTETWSATNVNHTMGVLHQDLTYKPGGTYFKGLP